MGGLIGAAALVALLAWLFFPRHRKHDAAPEDDVHTPIDRRELEEAERGLAEDRDAKQFGSEEADEDDWGPGAGGR